MSEEIPLSPYEEVLTHKIKKEFTRVCSGLSMRPPATGYVNLRKPPKWMLDAADKFLKERQPWDEIKVKR